MIHFRRNFFCRTVMGSLLCVAFSAAAQEHVEAPTYKDGEIWEFKVVEKGISGQGAAAGNYAVSFSAGRITVRPRFGQLRTMLFIEDDRQYLQFPLFVGKSWRAGYNDGGTVYMKGTTSVTGMEDVTTPAGTFRTFIVERHVSGIRRGGDAGRGEGRSAGHWLYTYYYSPQTRCLVKYYLEIGTGGRGLTREIELIKFGSDR